MHIPFSVRFAMTTTLKIAEVATLYESNHLQISQTLRVIADQIDAGEYGDVRHCVMALDGSETSYFSFGPEHTDMRAIALHSIAKAKIINALIGE